jgi:hypothetical protein
LLVLGNCQVASEKEADKGRKNDVPRSHAHPCERGVVGFCKVLNLG